MRGFEQWSGDGRWAEDVGTFIRAAKVRGQVSMYPAIKRVRRPGATRIVAPSSQQLRTSRVGDTKDEALYN